jgi:hypothetical protein
MRRAAVLLALGLAPLTAAAPASAGCVEDFVGQRPRPITLVQVAGTVQVGDDLTVTISPGWAVTAAGDRVSDVSAFVDCVV